MKTWLVVASLVFLTGCAGSQFRFGKLGSGIALPEEGPGVEFAFSDGQGKVKTGGRLGIDLPDSISPIWEALVGVLPKIEYTFGGNNVNTPTGP